MKLNRRMVLIILLLAGMAVVIHFMVTKNNKPSSPKPSPSEAVTISPTAPPEQQSAAAAYNSVNMEVMKLLEEGGEPDYSGYYAGAYVDGDGKLTIYLTEDIVEVRAYFIELADYKDTEFEIAQYPYSHLLEVMEVCNYADQQAFEETGFVVAGIDEVNNCVKVALREPTDEKIAAFKELIANSDCMVFEEYPFFPQESGDE